MTQKTFEHIALRLRSKALEVARWHHLSVDDAEDVAQDVMLKLWSMHDDIDSDGPVESYAAVVSKHLCIDRIRTRHEEGEYDESMSIAVEAEQQNWLEYQELEQWLSKRIDALPETNKLILTMRQIENRELDEIADILGINKSSVSTLLSRARRQLLNDLKKRNRQ